MKKVAFFKPRLNIVEGGLRVTVNICNELEKFYNVYLINFFQENCVFKIAQNVGKYSCVNTEKRLRKIFFQLIFNLRKYIKENKIEIIISETRVYLYLLYIATIGMDVKIIYHNHFALSEFINNQKAGKNLKERILYFINHCIEKKCKKIIVLTEKDKKDYIKIGVNNERIIILYNWLDSKLFDEKVTYNRNSKKIITVGRIDYQKGYEYLVQVAKMVFKKYPDWQWHIYGDGEQNYKNQIIDLIKQNNLENHLILQGNHSNIYDLYQNYSFYVMTSRYEGLPMVLLEAKAKKLPLISFDINSGPSDIIRDGVDGFLIKPFDCEAMADKICELIENPGLRPNLSDNAHENLDKFRKEKIVKQWCDLIENI